MRIGIDVRYLSHALVGGVHTYVTHFVSALVGLTDQHQLFLYADTKHPFELSNLPAHVSVRYLPYRNPLSSVYNDFFMYRAMAADRIEVAHFPTNYGFGPARARTIVTLHDELTIMPLSKTIGGGGTKRTARLMAMTVYMNYCSKRSLRKGHMLLTVSEHAKRQISKYSDFDPQKIVAVPHAPTPDLQRVTDTQRLAAVRAQYALPASFVLADGLKNPAVLIKAWRLLPAGARAGRQIVFFARREPLPIVREAEAMGDVKLLINPPRKDLIALYSTADAFLFPSWIEGFGLPILEAMTCGAPVIASDRGSIPEVAGDAALLADAEDAPQFAAYLERVLCHPQEAHRLREMGFARAKQFSWRHTAQRILETYQQAMQLPL